MSMRRAPTRRQRSQALGHSPRRVGRAEYSQHNRTECSLTLAEEHGSLAALPERWEDYWGAPLPTYRKQLLAFKVEMESLARGLVLVDGEKQYGELVHPSSNRSRPLHRWFSYKEAFAA